MFNYRVKVLRPSVSQRTYLWGGGGLQKNTSSSTILALLVDEFGEPIRIGTTKHPAGGGNSDEALGVLKPGEAFSVELKDIIGVFAESESGFDTYVNCSLSQPGN